jgi:hypothetical protein
MTAVDDLGQPRDVDAERAVLSGCMWSPAVIPDVAAVLDGDVWWLPAHGVLWAAILALAGQGVPADPVLLLDHLRAAGKVGTGEGKLDATYLHTVYAVAPPESAVMHHAGIVAALAMRRRLIGAGSRIAQRAAQAAVTDEAELAEWALNQVREIRDERPGVETLTVGVDEFMSVVPDEPDWVVPGLLARGDRFVLTGSGGIGKSTLLAQVAVCAAAGVPPFDWHEQDGFEPVRVMVLDCENADHQLKTRLWPMLREARDNGTPVDDRLTIGGRGNPLDLLNPQNALSLLRTVEHDKPDLVYIGPVYKLHNDDPDKEAVVKRITSVLDQIRATGAALITEAHHAKAAKQGGNMEPSGANLWTWWPEFGRGLRLDKDSDENVRRCALETWRIDRVARSWPQFVEAGGKWPWARARRGFTNDYL